MKILMLCEFFDEQLDYQENLLTKYYLKYGHQVTVVTSTFDSVFELLADRHDNSVPPRTYLHGGAKVMKLRFRYNILNRLRALTSIAQILEDEAPDLIFVHDIMLNLPEIVRYKKRHAGCRVIMDYHADYSNSGRNALSLKILHGVCRKWFLDRARPHLAKIFPVVPASATFLHEVYGVPREEMELLPLGADMDLGAEVRGRQEGQALRRSLGLSAQDLVIFSGGKLTPAKRSELLIEAVARLPDLPLHLFLIGDAGPQDSAYKRQLEALAADRPNVHLTGWLDRSDIHRYLDMADLAVFPASQSILWQQAIAMGLPLIVGDTGGQDISYLNLQQNIEILPRTEIHSERIAASIRRLAADPARLRQMAAGARRVADEHLDWNRLIQQTLRFNAAPGAAGAGAGSSTR